MGVISRRATLTPQPAGFKRPSPVIASDPTAAQAAGRGCAHVGACAGADARLASGGDDSMPIPSLPAPANRPRQCDLHPLA